MLVAAINPGNFKLDFKIPGLIVLIPENFQHLHFQFLPITNYNELHRTGFESGSRIFGDIDGGTG
ncbi:hypothetical protein D3C87_1869330 [compost metagenome]